jgi:hypothetical protein
MSFHLFSSNFLVQVNLLAQVIIFSIDLTVPLTKSEFTYDYAGVCEQQQSV